MTAKVLLITKKQKFINKKKFVIVALNLNTQIFIIHIANLEVKIKIVNLLGKIIILI